MSDSLKINVVYPADLLGGKVGGAETFLKGFIKYAPSDFDIHYIGVTSNPRKKLKTWTEEFIGSKKYNDFSVLFEKDENRKKFIPIALRFSLALKPLKEAFKENSVIFFNRLEPALFLGRSNHPKVVVIHNDIELQIKSNKSEVLWSKFPSLYFSLERSIFKKLNKIYTVSKNTLKHYIAQYPYQAQKFSFIPTWVDAEIFSPRGPRETIKSSLKKEFGIQSDDKWVLFVGRLQQQKAPIRLIDAFLEAYNKNNKLTLIVIGEGNLKNEVAEYVKSKKIAGSVVFINSMNQNQLARFYQAADVLLLTSNFEGMPMCVLEALGSGTPVVSTDVGEIRQVIRNGFSGEIVGGFEPLLIAEKVQTVLDNPTRYTEKNCLAAIEQFTPKKVLESMYDDIRALYSKNKKANEG